MISPCKIRMWRDIRPIARTHCCDVNCHNRVKFQYGFEAMFSIHCGLRTRLWNFICWIRRHVIKIMRTSSLSYFHSYNILHKSKNDILVTSFFADITSKLLYYLKIKLFVHSSTNTFRLSSSSRDSTAPFIHHTEGITWLTEGMRVPDYITTFLILLLQCS